MSESGKETGEWERELRGLGRIVGVADPAASAEVIGDAITSERDTLRDALRALVALDDGDNSTLWPHEALFEAARSALLLSTGGTGNG